MKQQRSSGGEKSVRGLLQLPELRRPTRRDTPKIANPVCQSSTRVPTAQLPDVDYIIELETTVGYCPTW